MSIKTPNSNNEAPTSCKVNMKVRPEILRMAKCVAAHRGQDLFDYVDEIFGPLIQQHYEAMILAEYEARIRTPPTQQ